MNRRVHALSALISFFTLVLMGMTGPLWLAQTDFPQVPLLSLTMDWPLWIGWVALGGMVASVVSLLWVSQIGQLSSQPTWQQAASLMLLGSFALLVLINQHRLQPWAYQFVIGLLILTHLPAKRAIQWFRLLVISIYFYSAPSKHIKEAEQSRSTTPWLFKAGLTLVLLAPWLEWIDYFDHWPSWGLYAASHDRVTLFVAESEIHRLPPSIRPWIDAPQADSTWCHVRIDRWSLQTLKAPLYPQARFQLGVALALGEKLRQTSPDSYRDANIKVILEGRAHRLSGKRQSWERVGLVEAGSLADRYWLNVRPVFR